MRDHGRVEVCSWLSRNVCVLALLFASCGSRAPRSSPTSSLDEPASSAPVDAASTAPAIPAGAPPSPAVEAPTQRLAWVDPARCLSPCTYDPEAELVRVDDAAVADPAGSYLVHRTIQDPLRALVSAARAAGHKLRVESGYRSYEYQAELFRKTKQRGRAARPGHSEHQLGTAVDLRMPTTAAITWLAEHASDHGFALSYPEGKQRITGYRPEPWHVRYVGAELVEELRTSGMTLQELFRARPDLGESGTCDDCPLPASRAACGTVTDAGRCAGAVLEWCFDGSLATVDCAASKQRCGRANRSSQYECIAR